MQFYPPSESASRGSPVALVCDCSREIVWEAQTAEDHGGGRDNLNSTESLRGHIKQHARVSCLVMTRLSTPRAIFPLLIFVAHLLRPWPDRTMTFSEGLCSQRCYNMTGTPVWNLRSASSLCSVSLDVAQQPFWTQFVSAALKALCSKKKVPEVGVRSHSSFRTPHYINNIGCCNTHSYDYHHAIWENV